jgi:hypothetical protein
MRLTVTVQHPEYVLLVDEQIAPPRRERTHPYLLVTGEVWTPGGLPLRFKLSLGAREELEIRTSETVLFQTFGLSDYFEMRLWLPTDETIEVRCSP